MRLIFGLLLIVSVAKANSQVWTVDSLLQTQTQHDGANCFNAVMVAKGYADYIHQTDASELRYVLEQTCQKRAENTKQQGDVLTVLREGTLEHAALATNTENVFEKLGIAGILGHFDDRADGSVYRIKPISKAPYFVNCVAPVCVVETYSCPGADVVKQKLKVCLAKRDEFGLNALDGELQRITFDTNKAVSLSQAGSRAMRQLVKSLSQLRGDDTCALYADAAAFSVFTDLSNLNQEMSSSDQKAIPISDLRNALKSLRGRIQTLDKSDLANAIFREQGPWR